MILKVCFMLSQRAGIEASLVDSVKLLGVQTLPLCLSLAAQDRKISHVQYAVYVPHTVIECWRTCRQHPDPR